MLLLRLTLWTGISVLYLGFAGVMGVLIRRNRRRNAGHVERLLATAHALLLFLPASAFVSGLPDWPVVIRFSALLAGVAVAWMGTVQPEWAPQTLWGRPFGHRYFAAAMALAAIWGIGLAVSAPALAPTLVGTSAIAAGAIALHTAPAER